MQLSRPNSVPPSGESGACRIGYPLGTKCLHRETRLEPALHPLASHDLPYFITAPGETDRMMVVTC
jgi:hypothetical protein